MANPIDEMFKTERPIRIMTHVVAGNPDLETSKEIIRVMARSGADLVEIQIPFSDPLADGPTIMTANQTALDNGTTPEDCFSMAEQLVKEVDIPLLFMTYVNIPFQMGMEKFLKRCADVGISGTIIPDIPFDERNEEYIALAKKHHIHPIQVVSPDVQHPRLMEIASHASGFIYTTLKVGITGARQEIDTSGINFIDNIRAVSPLPIAAGFGISSPKQIDTLKNKADIAVIGSHMINLYNDYGLEKIEEFLSNISYT